MFTIQYINALQYNSVLYYAHCTVRYCNVRYSTALYYYVYQKNIAEKCLSSTVALEVNKMYILYFETNVETNKSALSYLATFWTPTPPTHP